MVEKNSPLKLLYVTPEKLAKSKRFMTKLQASYKAGVFCRLAIDEVHCCSQWGHDFRPDYKFLGVMKSLFPKVPVIGLTATSTSRVTADCQKLLNLKNCLVFKAPFNRPNLFYEVRQKPESAEESVAALADMLSNEFSGQSGIIYTLTVKEVDTLAKNLREAGLRVAPYHAQLEPESR
jgi:ATP-dependent DNA helicase Q1